MATSAASAAPTRTSTKITTVANLAADYTSTTPTEVTASMSTQVMSTASIAAGLPLGMPSLRLPHHLPLLGGIDYAAKNVSTAHVAQPTATGVSATPPEFPELTRISEFLGFGPKIQKLLTFKIRLLQSLKLCCRPRA